MIDRIIHALKANASVADWLINVRETRSSELFYVGKKLETNRATDVTAYEVTLYLDKEENGEKKRGSASFSVYDYMNEEQLEEKVAEKVYAAGFALNPWFDLPSPVDTPIEESTSNIKDLTLKQAAEMVSDAVFKADQYDNGYLSATEIFVNKIDERVLNSKGIDISAVSYNAMVELIPSWKEEDQDVEIYHMMRLESLDPVAITQEVDEKLNLVHARYEAKDLSEVMDKANPAKVILQGNEVGTMFRYYIGDLNYGTKYTHSNRYEMGDPVQGETVTGTVLNLSMKGQVKGAFRSAAFDSDGVILKEKVLVKDGQAVGRFGDFRMGQYIREEEPTGELPITVVAPGEKSFAEMASEPYLRCVVFSGLQMERNSGYFGGEVRLGFYFDGEKEIPVTGFSISGNMKEAGHTMVYSSDVQTTAAFQGPKYLEIQGVSVV